jgi:NAD(P)-dependent dehydrogenase (short-subunit alcohol dehydrogenase family)
MGKLQGKMAVITGGTTGIGFASAKLFVKEGAYVFITGRRQKELDDAVHAIGSNVTGVQGDIAKPADLDRLYERVKKMGRIDVLFANAGTGGFVPLEDITEEYFDQTFNINVRGTLATTRSEHFTGSDKGFPSQGPVPMVASMIMPVSSQSMGCYAAETRRLRLSNPAATGRASRSFLRA